MIKPQTFIFVGRSGSGKGTQIDLLKEYITKLNPKIETYSFVMGDTFRSFMKEEGYAQNVIRDLINNGHLAPDFIANSLFISDLLHSLKSDEHLYIDGIPRSSAQVDAVIETIKFFNRINPIIIDVEVSKEEVEKRMLLRARHDDTKEAILERLKFYEDNIVPAVKLLREKSGFTYLEINGERTREEIHEDIISQLKDII
jgi:adenylate kinase family enzyme